MSNSSLILRQCDFLKDKLFPFMVETLPYSGIPNKTMHEHEFSEITVILSGTAEHCCMGKTVPVSCEQVLLVHPGTKHCFVNETDFRAISIMYDAKRPLSQLLSSDLEFLQKMYPSDYSTSHDQANPVTMIPACDFPFFVNMLLRIRYEIHRSRIGCRLIAPGIFCEMAGYFSRGYSAQSDFQNKSPLKNITDYINRHYREKISIPELSRSNGMSERSLYLAFQKNFHIAPYGYIMKVRLFHALELLGNTNKPLSSIAYETGLYDSNQLCKLFRKEYQMTPMQFRKHKITEKIINN